jgi:hypothetical protein
MSVDFVSVDRARLGRDIVTLARDAVHLKSVLRTRWLRPMGEEQRRLIRVRRSLTELFVVLALSRGKLHVKNPPREVREIGGPGFDPATWDGAAWARTVAARRLEDYQRTDAPGAEARP